MVKKFFKKLSIIVGISLYFISGYIYTVGELKQFQKGCLILGIGLLWVNMKKFKIYFCKRTLASYFYLIFGFFIFLSFIKNLEISIVISFLGIFSLYILNVIYLAENKKVLNYIVDKIYFILLIPYFTLILFCIKNQSIKLYSYKGIFTTSNGMGGSSVTAYVIILSLLVYDIVNSKKIKKLKILGEILLLLFVSFFLLISTSRTSIITGLIVTLLALLIILYKLLKQKRYIKICMIFLSLLIIFILLDIFFPLDIIMKNILNKFIRKVNDPLDHRTIFWKFIFSRVKWFGNGERVSIGAHNTFLSLLDQYGIFAFISWIFFILFNIFSSIKRIFSKKCLDKAKYLPFFVNISFLLMSLTEGMMLKTLMLLSIFSLSLFESNKIKLDYNKKMKIY